MLQKLDNIIESIENYKYIKHILYSFLALVFVLVIFLGLFDRYHLSNNYGYVYGNIIGIENTGEGQYVVFEYKLKEVIYKNSCAVDARYSHKIGDKYFIRYSKTYPSISSMEWDGILD